MCKLSVIVEHKLLHVSLKSQIARNNTESLTWLSLMVATTLTQSQAVRVLWDS